MEFSLESYISIQQDEEELEEEEEELVEDASERIRNELNEVYDDDINHLDNVLVSWFPFNLPVCIQHVSICVCVWTGTR